MSSTLKWEYSKRRRYLGCLIRRYIWWIETGEIDDQKNLNLRPQKNIYTSSQFAQPGASSMTLRVCLLGRESSTRSHGHSENRHQMRMRNFPNQTSQWCYLELSHFQATKQQSSVWRIVCGSYVRSEEVRGGFRGVTKIRHSLARRAGVRSCACDLFIVDHHKKD
jgi:hypothetical protein